MPNTYRKIGVRRGTATSSSTTSGTTSLPDFPASFASLAHAREFCAGFFHEYNYIHRHSGIAWHTPASVHFGTAEAIDQDRQNTLTAAYHAHPERFGRRPHPPVMPTQFWVNQPENEPQMN